MYCYTIKLSDLSQIMYLIRIYCLALRMLSCNQITIILMSKCLYAVALTCTFVAFTMPSFFFACHHLMREPENRVVTV